MHEAAVNRPRRALPVPRPGLRPILVLAVAWLAVSCQHAPPGPAAPALSALPGQLAPAAVGVEPLQARHRWWNYYRRSLEYALAGDWQRAAWDLEIALGRRPGVPFGADREARRAKTYGLHHLNDYFPHRELGVCLFRLGQLEAAERELLASLEMLPSSRAKFYLNEVRQQRLQGAVMPAPSAFSIDLLPGDDPLLTNRLHLDLRGTISISGFVSGVSVNGIPLFVELAAAVYSLAESVLLSPGEQDVLVEAEDLQGRRVRASRRVIVDLRGPEIALTRPPGGGPGEVLVNVADDRELAAVEIDGRALALVPAQISVSSRVTLGEDATLAVIAVDRAGNRTVLGGAANSRQQAATGAASATDWRLAGRPGVLHLSGACGGPILLAQAAPSAAAAGGPSGPDTLPPVLLLSPRLPERIVVTRDAYVVDLQIEDSGGVAALTIAINGLEETREFTPADADVQCLTRTVSLAHGQNQIEIAARDRAGNTTQVRAQIERRTDHAWREDLRVTSQVLPPASAAPSAGPPVDLYPLLIEALTRDPPRLNLVEREPAVMQRLLEEFALADSPLADQIRAIRKGKLRTADWCLVSRLTVWPGKENFDLVLEVVDVAKTEILLTTDIHFSSVGRDHVRSQLRGLVGKLEQQLPRLTAPIVARSAGTIVLPLGEKQQIRRGMYVLFMPAAAAADDPAPVTWRDGVWVQGRVNKVLANSCRVEVAPARAAALVKVNDRALLR